MDLETLEPILLPAIEGELHRVLNSLLDSGNEELYKMLAYHLGWEGEGASEQTRGKRVRPCLLLLTNLAAGGEWRQALPAAAAVELAHNFSLIHDDIQDNSPLRRGRPTVWKLWGIAQAINAGDAMYTLAFMAILGIDQYTSAKVVLQAIKILQEACLQLTKGQYLDLAYETKTSLTIAEYWAMVRGKTASLLAACTEIGALIANSSTTKRLAFRDFGYNLGLAFQAQDDLIGIWGDALLTGKSNLSDLLSRKKSLPVLYGLSKDGLFAKHWYKGQFDQEEIPTLAIQLDTEGAKAFTEETASQLTNQALERLALADPGGKASIPLKNLALTLLGRKQ